MRNWEQLFAKVKNSGVYSVEEAACPEVRKAAAQAGLAVFHLNLADINEKVGFLDAAAKALQFPSHFGSNWDAFEDCLTDLSWFEARGYVLLIQNLESFHKNAPAEMAMARTILQDVAAYWKLHGVRFFVGLAAEAHCPA
jgi:RNAse (barnase) inhibitor barstar